ncbi:hypothetical protein ACFT8P_20560 [Streptomyces sp. NPDC057101]
MELPRPPGRGDPENRQAGQQRMTGDRFDEVKGYGDRLPAPAADQQLSE